MKSILFSAQTIRNRLENVGSMAKHKVKKLAISMVNRKNRSEFAERHENWTAADSQRVIRSDWTNINRFGPNKRLWCWMAFGKPLSDRITQLTVKHGSSSVMVWGCMTA